MPRLPLLPTLLHRARVTQTPCTFSPPRLAAVQLRFSPVRQCTRTFASTPRAPQNPVWPYLYKPFDKMAQLDSVFKEIDGLQETFIQRLKEAVAIPSISSEDDRRPDVFKVRCTVLCGKTGQKPVLTDETDGPLARGPDQSTGRYRRASRARQAAWT